MKPVTVEVLERTSAATGYSVEELCGSGRNFGLTDARAIAWYVLRRFHRMEWTEIGREFGRDHSTIWKCVERFTRRIEDDRDLRFQVLDVARKQEGSLLAIAARVDAEIMHARQVLHDLEAVRATIEREVSGHRRTVLAS